MSTFRDSENKKLNDILLFIAFIIIILMVRSCIIDTKSDYLCEKVCALRGHYYDHREVDGLFDYIKCYCGKKKT